MVMFCWKKTRGKSHFSSIPTDFWKYCGEVKEFPSPKMSLWNFNNFRWQIFWNGAVICSLWKHKLASDLAPWKSFSGCDYHPETIECNNLIIINSSSMILCILHKYESVKPKITEFGNKRNSAYLIQFKMDNIT